MSSQTIIRSLEKIKMTSTFFTFWSLNRGQGAASVHEALALHRVRRRVEPFGVFVRRFSLQLLQDVVSMTWTRDLLVTRWQLLPLCRGSPSFRFLNRKNKNSIGSFGCHDHLASVTAAWRLPPQPLVHVDASCGVARLDLASNAARLGFLCIAA
jgi:hypothetical protein